MTSKQEYTKCVRCGLTIPANETSLHVEEFHNDEFQSWKKRFGFDKLEKELEEE